MVDSADLPPEGDDALLEQFCRYQVLLGKLLHARGIVPTTLYNQALIDYDAEQLSLGDYLIERGIITESVLQDALVEQAQEQQRAYQIVQEVA